MPAECGGVTTPPLLSNALRLQTARGKSALVASVATGRCGRDSVCLMHGRADPERKGAGSRAQAGRGMAAWDGLGSAPQKLDLQMPNQFQSVDQPQPAAASGLPHLVVERKSLGGAWGNALKWSIIDLAREHSNARISRQQGGHCRWQVAAGGDRMWPTCAMRWCWARFGGAHRESSPAMPPLQLPAWSRSRAVLKCVHSFQSLQAIPDEKCHLRVGERKL